MDDLSFMIFDLQVGAHVPFFQRCAVWLSALGFFSGAVLAQPGSAQSPADIEPPRLSIPVPPQLPGTPAAGAPESAGLTPPPAPGELQAAEVPALSLRKKDGQTTSTSSSGQFVVHGNDLTLRSAFSSRCEEISSELRQFLKDEREPWTHPIVVMLNSGAAAQKKVKTASMSLAQVENRGGFHIQVTVQLRSDFQLSDFRAEILRALLAERVLRGLQELRTQRAELLPDWVYTGLMEALAYRKQARPSALFAAIFKSGKIFGIEEIIEASPTDMDALSKSIYRVSCCALVLALMDQDQGGTRLDRFLASLAGSSQPERQLLDQAYPSFAASPAALNKWWALQLADLSRPGLSEPLSPVDTLRALEEALTLRFQARADEVPKPRNALADVLPLAAAPEAAPEAAPAIQSTEAPEVVKPTPRRPPSNVRPRPRTETQPVAAAPSDPAPEPAATESEKRGFFSRLNPFSRRQKTGDEAVIESAIRDAARDEAQTRSVSQTASETPQVITTQLPESVTTVRPSASKPVQAATKAKPRNNQPAASVEDSPAAGKKRSRLNPINWFRGEEKPTDAADPAEPEKPKTSQRSQRVDSSLWASLSPSGLAQPVYIYQQLETPNKRRLFGLLGPKSEEKKEAKPAAVPAPAEPRNPIKIRPLFSSEESTPATAPVTMALEPAEARLPAAEPKKSAPSRRPRSRSEARISVPKMDPDPTPARAGTEANTAALIAATLPIDDYAYVLKRPDRREILANNLLALRALQLRGSVLFRPIITEYAGIVEEMMNGKVRKNTPQRLTSLRERCLQALKQSRAVRDLLDTHEANSSSAMSGTFDDYLNLPETIRRELPPRTDAISIYLDAIDREFSAP
jgi:hypothetical protein